MIGDAVAGSTATFIRKAPVGCDSARAEGGHDLVRTETEARGQRHVEVHKVYRRNRRDMAESATLSIFARAFLRFSLRHLWHCLPSAQFHSCLFFQLQLHPDDAIVVLR